MDMDNVNPTPPQGISKPQNVLLSGAPQMQPPTQTGPRAPTHAETVAALRHFSEIKTVLRKLSENPALGRSSIKNAIIEATTDLVGESLITPAAAVEVLSKVPPEPLMQMHMIKEMMQQVTAAANNILDHHSIGTPGSLNWAIESAHTPYSPSDHLSIMDGLHGNYRPAQ